MLSRAPCSLHLQILNYSFLLLRKYRWHSRLHRHLNMYQKQEYNIAIFYTTLRKFSENDISIQLFLKTKSSICDMVEMQQKLGYTTNRKATHLCTIANVSISRSNTLVLLSILAEFRHELPFDILNNSVLHFRCVLLAKKESILVTYYVSIISHCLLLYSYEIFINVL